MTKLEGTSCYGDGKKADDDACDLFFDKKGPAYLNALPRVKACLAESSAVPDGVQFDDALYQEIRTIANSPVSLPKAYRGSRDSQRVQAALQLASEHRQRSVFVMVQASRECVSQKMIRRRMEAAVSRVPELVKLAKQYERTAFLEVVCHVIDNRILFLDHVIMACRALQQQMDYVKDSVAEMTKAHYAVKSMRE